MQEKTKEILSIYLKMPADKINTATIIDRSVVSSSILLHRMYAKLAAENIIVNDYQQVRTFGDLLQQVSNGTGNTNMVTPAGAASGVNELPVSVLPVTAKDDAGIGIDIEMVAAMPVTGDFREDHFYTMNFSAAEISYCILQPKPYTSFAGLFAAKEAIVKADNSFKKTAFKNIPIQHLPNGKPFHAAFNISVSHTNEIAVAVAIPVQHNNVPAKEPATGVTVKPAGNTSVLVWVLIVTSLLLSAVALFLTYKGR